MVFINIGSAEQIQNTEQKTARLGSQPLKTQNARKHGKKGAKLLMARHGVYCRSSRSNDRARRTGRRGILLCEGVLSILYLNNYICDYMVMFT
jgi:hypothetical protein